MLISINTVYMCTNSMNTRYSEREHIHKYSSVQANAVAVCITENVK